MKERIVKASRRLDALMADYDVPAELLTGAVLTAMLLRWIAF
jgi:hypothetical protein